MRKIVGLLVGCLVLSGCAGAAKWERDIRFKIVKVYEVGAEHDRKYDTLRMELVGDVPEDVLEPDTVTPQARKRWEITGEVREGDEVLCNARQTSDGYTQANVIHTYMSCKKV